MKRLVLTSALALAATLALAGCGTTQAASSGSGGDAISITDATGTAVKLDGPAKTVVGTEWNVVEDLVTLGVQPAGVADVKGYTAWDTAAPLTGGPKDIGTRGEPSYDTIAALNPDLIVATTDLKASVITQLRKIAPVLVTSSADSSDQIGTMFDTLDQIAKATGTTSEAKAARTSFDDTIADDKQRLADAGLVGQSVASADGYVVSNQVTIRPYTAGSLLGAVNTELGLENAWSMDGDKAYGLASTDVEGLTGLGDVPFLYIANDTDGDPVTDALKDNAVWNSLAFVQSDRVHRLPDGTWMFGGPKAMEAYADAVVTALTK
jgi:ferric hydroxamate transport system substrate-binding protein